MTEPRTPQPPASARREHDSRIGRASIQKSCVPDGELKSCSPEPENEPDFDPEDLLKSDFELPDWIRHSLRVILLVIAAAALFFITVETASFLASIRNFSRTEQLLLTVPMMIFGGILLWYLLKLLWLSSRLRKSNPIPLKALQMLEERRDLRKLSLKANQDAVNQLSLLLRDSYRDHRAVLQKFKVPSEEIDRLERQRQTLLDQAENLPKTSLEWIGDFRTLYQDPLDEIARARILRHSAHAGIMTGISPYPLIDRLIVLYSCISMLKDLLEIYALKPAWDKNLILLVQVVCQTYLAGVVDEAAEQSIDLVMDHIPELTGKTLSSTWDLMLRKTAGKSAGMLAQGIMVYRLGCTAQKMLRPVNTAK